MEGGQGHGRERFKKIRQSGIKGEALAELGQPAANLSSLFGLYAPAQTPKTVITRINTEVNKALALPDIRAKLDATDNVPTGGTTAEFARQIALESENNARIIRAAGIQGN